MIHSREPWQVRLRALLLTAVTLAALAGCLHGALAVARRTTDLAGESGQSFATLLVLGCAGAVVAALAWLCVLVLSAAVPLALHARVAPVRRGRAARIVAGVCGLALTAGIAPAGAHEAPTEAVSISRTGPALLHGLPLPSRPVADRQAPAAVAVHRVRPGDTLWAIAAAELGRGASPARIQARWQQIHAANAASVPDPDLIQVGALLRLPPH